MNAPATIPQVPQSAAPVPLDDITTILGAIRADEYEARVKLRGFRNAAAAMIASTECVPSGQLAWMASDLCSAWLYSPADCDELAEVGKLARRLMLCAMQAELMRDRGLLA